MQEGREGRIARGWGAAVWTPKMGRCTKIRRNTPKRPIRGFPGPPYTYAYPRTQKPHGGPIRAIADDSAIVRKPPFPARRRNPHGLPCSGCTRFNPGPVPGSCGRHAEAQKPRTRRGLIPASLSDYAGCIVLNASGIFRLSHSINRRVHLADPPRARRHHPNRVPP